jgi:hypothetical protein
MRPIKFKQANKTLLKPDSMTDKECSSLDILTDGKECISCWKPTWKERFSMLFFGCVWVWVVSGQTQPPISLWATKTIFNTKDK